MTKPSCCIVQTTCPDEKSCQRIIDELFNHHLAACIHTQEIKSHYIWNKKIEHDKEILLGIKTQNTHFHAIEKLIKSIHPYEVPEILLLPIIDGSPEYLEWLINNISV